MKVLRASPAVLRKLFSAGFLAVMFTALVLGFSPVVHATNPSVTSLNTGSNCGIGVSTCTAAITESAGTTIVVHVNLLTNTVTQGVLTVDDGGANSFIQVAGTGGRQSMSATVTSNGLGIDSETWYALDPSTAGAKTVTVTLNAVSPARWYISVEQISVQASPVVPLGSSYFVSGTFSNSCSAAPNCYVSGASISVPFQAGSIILGVLDAASCPGTSCNSGATSGGPLSSPTYTNLAAVLTGSGSSGSNAEFGGFNIAAQYEAGAGTLFFATNTAIDTTAEYVLWGWSVMVFNPNPSGTTTQSQSVGSCPTATTGNHGVYLKNSTINLYPANALGAEVVNSISVQLNQVKGSAAQEFQLLIYASSAQTPSISSPAFRVFAQGYLITAGTTNQTFTAQVSIPLNNPVTNALPFNYWAVGIVGNDHISITTSTLSGMFNQTGNPSTANQPSSFTSVGISTTKPKLALCASASYQSVIAFTSTSVVASGTSTVTTTSTSTIVSLNNINSLVFGNNNFMLAIIVILGPALAIGGATRALWGAMLGASLGVAIGVYVGFVPFYIIVFIALAIIAALFFSRGQGNSLGG